VSAKTSVTAIVTEHFDTLRDARTSRPLVWDYLAQFGLPLLVAVVAPSIGFRLVEVGQLIAGLAVFTGFTFGLLIFVFQLRLQVASDPRVPDDNGLRELIDQLFVNIAYALLVAFASVLAAVIVVSVEWPMSPLPSGWASGLQTALLLFLTLHYVATMAMCAKRLHRAYSMATA
jgi:hydrogenase-4 membrane subunit HyfE